MDGELMICRVCGLDHSPRENCGFARRKAEYAASLVANTESIPVVVANEAMPMVANKSRHGMHSEANKQKRLEYMRELMRKRRANG